MNEFNYHYSVLKQEALDLLNIKPDGIYVDCTFGRGGHSSEIIKKLSDKGKLIVIDLDLEAEKYFKENFNFNNVFFCHGNFKDIKSFLEELGINKVDGILYDFGVSSPQLDDPKRGFSYHQDSLLDMRMDQSKELTASKVLMTYSKKDLINIFRKYGDINYSEKVVDAIIEYRKNNSEISTLEFVDLIKANIPKKFLFQDKHPARQFFQALRIEVNDELKSIEISIKAASTLLNKNGRIVTISFHSLEDKIIKDYFRVLTESKIPKEILINEKKEYEIIKTKYKPSKEELEENNRSRSARIRCIEKRM